MKKLIKFIALIGTICLLVSVVSAAGPGVLMYNKYQNNTFGPWVMRDTGWDRFLMYYSCNSTVKNGKPSTVSPGDSGTNYGSSYWADRIWLTWSYDNGGKIGWDQDGGPYLMLAPGGSGEGRLIGDPSVVYWQNKWHMFYEGTDDPTGMNNRIFHATANNWNGPWTKQGMVNGLWADTRSCGISWPTVLVDNGQLILYFTDNSLRLMAAINTDTTGSNFTMANYNGGLPLNYDPNNGTINPAPVCSNVNRGTVKYFNGVYQLVHDNYARTTTYTRTSSNKFDFNNSTATQIMSINDGAWYSVRVGLPAFAYGSYTNRIYFTGQSPLSGIPEGRSEIGYYE